MDRSVLLRRTLHTGLLVRGHAYGIFTDAWMVFQSLELTTALRPELYPEETLLFVQDAVGIYEGKFKLPNYQNGHIYLTSHRVCYVDNEDPRGHAIAVALKDIDRHEITAKFFKSSPKVTLFPKPRKYGSIHLRPAANSNGSAALLSPRGSFTPPSNIDNASRNDSFSQSRPVSQSVTWICPVCSFSNTLPSGFDATTANEQTPLAPCQTCGIKPPLALLLKAAISNATSHSTPNDPSSHASPASRAMATSDVDPSTVGVGNADQARSICQRCTFENHPSLSSCEMCGAALRPPQGLGTTPVNDDLRVDSPGPTMDSSKPLQDTNVESVKLSFRAGGDKVFYERLKGAMLQRKWLSDNAPPIPLPSHQQSNLSTPSRSETATPDSRSVGIAGLEKLRLDRRRNNETVISSAFEDLEALMASAQEIINIAESFKDKSPDVSASKIINDAVLGMATTRDKLDAGAGSETLYLTELSRTLAEYLTDDRQGVLKREGGVMSLVDLWAAFNRARNGVELVSPADFERAARMWEGLNLPVRLRQFKNGLLVVQRRDWNDDKTISQILAWLGELHSVQYIEQALWDQETFGRGVTAQEAATRFGWSVGVAVEELGMAEERGVLCREESIEGLKFWENWIAREI